MNIKNKNFAVIGAGNYGTTAVKLIRNMGGKVVYLFDNNTELWGTVIEGICVQKIDKKKLSGIDYILIGSIQYGMQIKNQLIALGCDEIKFLGYKEFVNMISSVDYDYYKKNIYESNRSSYTVDRHRILYDGQILSEQKRGGITRYFYELMRGIACQKNFDIDLFAGVNISACDFNNIKDTNWRYFGCRAEKNALLERLIREKINSALYCAFNEKSEEYEIYHPTYYWDVGIKKYKRKVVTVHDMIHEKFQLGDITIQAKKKSILEADGIISISESTKRDIIDILGIEEDRIKVIYHGNSIRLQDPGERIFKNPYILFVGNRDLYKNFDNFVKAFAMSYYRNELMLLCFGGGKFRPEELKLCEQIGINKNIVWMEGDDNILANLYKYAEIFVYPTKYEGFGMPILEAMYYGTPVLTGNVSSMPEIGGDAAEYFDPYSIEDMTTKLDCLINDENRRRELLNKGKMREKKFSWSRCVRETEAYYNTLLSK